MISAHKNPKKNVQNNPWPTEVVTVVQVQQALEEMARLRGWLKQSERSVKVGAITNAPRPVVGAHTQAIAGELDLKKANLADLEELTDAVERNLQQSIEIHITLPDLPQADIKSNFANWFRNNISPKILLNFSADSGLAGGMVVRTRNHIYNFSLSRQLWQQRALIPEIVRRA